MRLAADDNFLVAVVGQNISPPAKACLQKFPALPGKRSLLQYCLIAPRQMNRAIGVPTFGMDFATFHFSVIPSQRMNPERIKTASLLP
jgi:hypothetical protein